MSPRGSYGQLMLDILGKHRPDCSQLLHEVLRVRWSNTSCISRSGAMVLDMFVFIEASTGFRV